MSEVKDLLIGVSRESNVTGPVSILRILINVKNEVYRSGVLKWKMHGNFVSKFRLSLIGRSYGLIDHSSVAYYSAIISCTKPILLYLALSPLYMYMYEYMTSLNYFIISNIRGSEMEKSHE